MNVTKRYRLVQKLCENLTYDTGIVEGVAADARRLEETFQRLKYAVELDDPVKILTLIRLINRASGTSVPETIAISGRPRVGILEDILNALLQEETLSRDQMDNVILSMIDFLTFGGDGQYVYSEKLFV